MIFLEEAKKEREYLQKCQRAYKRLENIKVNGEMQVRLREAGNIEYYLKLPGIKRRYLKKEDEQLIIRFKAKVLGATGVNAIERNIDRLNKLIDSYEDCSMGAIWRQIPKGYRFAELDESVFMLAGKRKPIMQSEDPKRRENLIHTTTFGLRVRSKNELLIAEELYAAGIEFRYEQALEIKVDSKGGTRTVYPDFTINLPRGKVRYWEHKGLYTNREYREQDFWKMTMYYFNGIYPPRNLIVTMDGPNGEFDGTDVRVIVRSLKEELEAGGH